MNKKLKIKRKHITLFVILVLILLLILAAKTTNNFTFEKKKVREAVAAGSWYPGDKSTLKVSIDKYLANVNRAELNGTIRAIIVPHAGYSFSGQVAATAFRQLKEDYKTVIILAPSHSLNFIGASLPSFTRYQTPLGLVKVSEKVKELFKERLFQSHPEAHVEEHAIEIELPFLQTVLKDFEIIPIIIGASTTPDELNSIAQTLKKYVDDKTLIVVSSDFTHYGPNYGYIPFTENIPENLKNLDLTAADRILSKDPEGFLQFLNKTQCTICGRQPITILLYMFKDENIKPHFLYYTTSGALTNDYTNSVSYITMAFTEQDWQLTKEEQEFLLTLARDTAEKYLKTGKKPVVNETKLTPALKKVQGCFTTLNKYDKLRGCIGHILPQEELYKCVMDNAISAAVNDKRFTPVIYDELNDIKIEISALTVPQRLEFSSGEDLLNKLRPMVDGVVLKQGYKQSTYLPQVWANFANKEEFLPSLCIKGGMAEDCWKDTNTEVYTYQAFVFEEE